MLQEKVDNPDLKANSSTHPDAYASMTEATLPSPAPSARSVPGSRLLGNVFGRLTVIGIPFTKGDRRYVECVCSCGVLHTPSLSSLLSGRSKSCGCLRRKVTSASPRLRPKRPRKEIWPAQDVERLRLLAQTCMTDSQIAHALGRTTKSVQAKRTRLAIEKPIVSTQKKDPAKPKVRYCKLCKERLERRPDETVGNFKGRLTCSEAHERESRRRTQEEVLSARNGWPRIDRDFRWPATARFTDDDDAIKANLGHLNMLPPLRHSVTGSSARMLLDGEGGSTGRRK